MKPLLCDHSNESYQAVFASDTQFIMLYKVVLTFNYLDDMKATLHPCGILALCRTLLVFPSVMYVTWFPTLSSQFISVLSLKSASSCFHLTKITQMGEFFLSSSNKNCRRKSHLRALSSDSCPYVGGLSHDSASRDHTTRSVLANDEKESFSGEL